MKKHTISIQLTTEEATELHRTLVRRRMDLHDPRVSASLEVQVLFKDMFDAVMDELTKVFNGQMDHE